MTGPFGVGVGEAGRKDEILIALKATPDDMLADVPKPYFLGHLADYGVNTFDLSEEEIVHDFRNA